MVVRSVTCRTGTRSSASTTAPSMIDASAPVSMIPRPRNSKGTWRPSLRRSSTSSRVNQIAISTTAPICPMLPVTRPGLDSGELIGDHHVRNNDRPVLFENLIDVEASRRSMAESCCHRFNICFVKLRLWNAVNQQCPLTGMFGQQRRPLNLKCGLQFIENGINPHALQFISHEFLSSAPLMYTRSRSHLGSRGHELDP